MNEKHITITELNKYIKSIIDNDIHLKSVYIKGEVSNFKRHTRGHCYFTLKDETSRINAVMFSSSASKLKFTPRDGDSVLVRGRISVYEANGNYQVYVDEMTEDGIGDLYVEFERLKEKLAKEGLFSSLHKKSIPTLPKKIGIITASTGAAVKDIMTTVNRRFPMTQCILFPSLVQGEGAKDDIVRQIKRANESDVDTIICGRGGGSIEDLWPFNEEIVARAIFESEKPIISAVGHEVDFTIADFVADLRAPTPTAAAELAVPSLEEVKKAINNYKNNLNMYIQKLLVHSKEKMKKYENSYILNNPGGMYEVKEQKLDNLIDKVNIMIKNIMERKQHNFVSTNTKLELLNPISILNKGYSITKKDDKLIKNAKDLKIGDKIDIKLGNGEISGEVKEVR